MKLDCLWNMYMDTVDLYKYGFKLTAKNNMTELYTNNIGSIVTLEDMHFSMSRVIDVYNKNNKKGLQLNIPYQELAFDYVYGQREKNNMVDNYESILFDRN